MHAYSGNWNELKDWFYNLAEWQPSCDSWSQPSSIQKFVYNARQRASSTCPTGTNSCRCDVVGFGGDKSSTQPSEQSQKKSLKVRLGLDSIFVVVPQYKLTYRPKGVSNYGSFLGEMQRIAFHLMLSSCVCVCICLSCVCVFVCMPRLWTSGKRFEIVTSFFFKLRGMTPDIICKSFTQIGLQIPIWRTKWRLWNTINGCNSAIY